MQIIKIPISELILDPSNARKHSPRNLESIKGSLRRWGQQKPIVIDKKKVIVAGNGTVMAAKDLGWKEIQAYQTDLEGYEAMAFAIADNRTAELAEWEESVLHESLAKLELNDIDLSFLDFELPELPKEGLTDEDSVPEPKEENKYGVKLGDIWQLGEHRVMCGDSTDIKSIEKLTDFETLDFCFTSPPYSDQRDYRGEINLSPEHLASFLGANCRLFAVNLGMKRNDHEIIPYWDDYIKVAKQFGLKLLSWNIWDRSEAGFTVGQSTAMFAIAHEWIFIFGKHPTKLKKTVENKSAGTTKKSTLRNKDGSTTGYTTTTNSHRQLSTVFKSDIARFVGDDHKHPAMFPVVLPEEHILACTDSDGVVFEPYCGSGTTLIACEKTSRKCYGMEIDPHYCSVIIERWENFTGNTAKIIEST